MINVRIVGRAFMVAAMLAVFFPSLATADDWSSHGLNLSHQRLTAERSGAAFRGARWTLPFSGETGSVSSPAVADDHLVFGDFDGVVRAVGATDGQLRWQVKVGQAIYAAPAIHRGKVFVPSLDNKLYAFRLSNGTVAWQKELGGLEFASPVVSDGALIVAAGFPNRKIIKLDAATGETLWESPADALEQFSNSSAAIAGDQVIIGANSGKYFSFDLGTGALRWTYQADGIVNLSAPVVLEGRAFMLPGGSSRKLHAVDIATGLAVDGWPIDLPVAAPDIAGKRIGGEQAISSLSAADGRVIFDIRFDDHLDTNADALADRFLLREYLFAVDGASGAIAWKKTNGRVVLTDESLIPKYWLCPTPALFQTASGPLVAAASTLIADVRVLDVKNGADRGVSTTSGPTQISPVVANGRLFFGSAGGIHGVLSSVNQPPTTPLAVGAEGRAISATAATLRWSAALDPNADGVTYQLRVDRDGELLESWEHEFTTDRGQTAFTLPVPLPSGVTFTFAIRARDSKGAWSEWSPPATFLAAETPTVSVGGQPRGDLVAALLGALPGTVVTLGAGTFNLSATLRVPAGVTLTGAGPNRTILNASGLDVGVTLEGSAADQPTQMNNLTVAGAKVGIALRDTRDAVLKHLIVRDNTEAGVEVSSNASAQLVNATLLRNKTGVKSFGVVLVKNSVVAHGETAFWANGANGIASKFNDTYANTVDYRNIQPGLGDFNAELTWTDAGGNDFHLLREQPSTDRGDPQDDFSKEPLPNGGRINLGAYGGTEEAELSPEITEPPPITRHDDGGCSVAGTTSHHGWLSLAAMLLAALAATFARSRRRTPTRGRTERRR